MKQIKLRKLIWVEKVANNFICQVLIVYYYSTEKVLLKDVFSKKHMGHNLLWKFIQLMYNYTSLDVSEMHYDFFDLLLVPSSKVLTLVDLTWGKNNN